jgi:hypothetical protein
MSLLSSRLAKVISSRLSCRRSLLIPLARLLGISLGHSVAGQYCFLNYFCFLNLVTSVLVAELSVNSVVITARSSSPFTIPKLLT